MKATTEMLKTQLIALGYPQDPGPTIIPAHDEVELRGQLGLHVAYNLHVLPSNPEDYGSRSPQLTLVRAFLYPPSRQDEQCGKVIWSDGAPSCEDFERGWRAHHAPVDAGGIRDWRGGEEQHVRSAGGGDRGRVHVAW